jgi:hypothetical protein
MPYVCDIFNVILESGVFPENGKKKLLYPYSSYRGVTLFSCLSKLFTSVLNNRIGFFCFKRGSSTIDAIFSFYTFIEHYRYHNQRLYVGFID